MLVQILYRAGKLRCNRRCFALGQLLLRNDVAEQVRATNVVNDKVDAVDVLDHVVQLDDVRMVKLLQQVNLALDQFNGMVGQLQLPVDLDGLHLTRHIVLALADLVDVALGADLLLNRVILVERGEVGVDLGLYLGPVIHVRFQAVRIAGVLDVVVVVIHAKSFLFFHEAAELLV